MSDERGTTAFDVKLGAKVRARRLQLGISQERLAEILGITFQQVQKYEKGVNRIAASRLYDICSALDMPIASMLEGFEGAKTAPAPGADDLDAALALPGAHDLVRLFARLKTSSLRKRVLALVRTLGEE